MSLEHSICQQHPARLSNVRQYWYLEREKKTDIDITLPLPTLNTISLMMLSGHMVLLKKTTFLRTLFILLSFQGIDITIIDNL